MQVQGFGELPFFGNLREMTRISTVARPLLLGEKASQDRGAESARPGLFACEKATALCDSALAHSWTCGILAHGLGPIMRRAPRGTKPFQER